MMSSYNRLFSRYACLKPRIYQNYYDVSLQFLAIVILVLQANSKFERMHDCNCCFIIKRDISAYGWLQGNCELALKRGMTESACLKEIQYARSLRVAP